MRREGAVAGVFATTLLLAGCTQQSCTSYIDYESPQQMFDAATVVFVGTVGPAAQSVDVEGASTQAFSFVVEQVLKGESEPSATPLVATAPDECASSSTSLLSSGERVILFAAPTNRDDLYVTITPYDGVIEFPDSEQTLPFESD